MAEPMLEISAEQVRFIIVKARAFDEKVAPVEPDPGSDAVDDDQAGVLSDYADDPTLQELTAALESLNVDQQSDLVALMWLGRGTFDDWSEARAEAAALRHRHVPSYLAGTPLLGDYLAEGLAALGLPVEDEDDDA